MLRFFLMVFFVLKSVTSRRYRRLCYPPVFTHPVTLPQRAPNPSSYISISISAELSCHPYLRIV